MAVKRRKKPAPAKKRKKAEPKKKHKMPKGGWPSGLSEEAENGLCFGQDILIVRNPP